MTYDQVIKRIFIQNPFYGLVLMGLPIEETDSVKTLGVSLNKDMLTFTLSINTGFWKSLTDFQQIEVFKHELLHICFYHCLIGKGYRNHTLFNIAADGEVNQYLNKKYLPSGCVDLIQAYPGIAAKAGAKYYYEFLLQRAKSLKDNSNSRAQESGYGDVFDDHSAWEEIDKMTEAEKELVSESLDKALIEAYNGSKGRGTLPGSLEEYIKGLLERKPVFNWKAYFRRLVGNAEEIWVKTSRKKESRRFSEGAGIKKIHYSTVLVGIDTSGSVSTDELREFLTEIKHISKVKSVNVEIAEFDSRIQRVYKLSRTSQGKILGRGGTDFQPVVDLYNENRKKYTTLIIFSDGGAPIPNNVPGSCIWVLTGNKEAKFPGKVIYIDRESC